MIIVIKKGTAQDDVKKLVADIEAAGRGALSAGGAPSLSLPAQVLFRSSPLRLIICGASGEVKPFRAPNRLKTDCRQFSCVSPFADA